MGKLQVNGDVVANKFTGTATGYEKHLHGSIWHASSPNWYTIGKIVASSDSASIDVLFTVSNSYNHHNSCQLAFLVSGDYYSGLSVTMLHNYNAQEHLSKVRAVVIDKGEYAVQIYYSTSNSNTVYCNSFQLSKFPTVTVTMPCTQETLSGTIYECPVNQYTSGQVRYGSTLPTDLLYQGSVFYKLV